MGGASRNVTNTRTVRYPFGATAVDWSQVADKFAKEFVRRSMDHRAHCLIWERLTTPQDAHVKAWERWKRQPWTWKNYVAHGLNRFYQWLESGK